MHYLTEMFWSMLAMAWFYFVMKWIVQDAVEGALKASAKSAAHGSASPFEPLLKEIYELQAAVEELQPMAEAYNRSRYSDEAIERELWASVRKDTRTGAQI